MALQEELPRPIEKTSVKQKYLIIDTETEGLNLINSRPWQASWITAQGKQIYSKNDRFIFWNDLKVSEGAAKITGFNQQTYSSKAESPIKVLEDLWNLISNPDYLIIGQNILGFDVYVLNCWRKICGYKTDYSYLDRVIDTRAIAMAISLGHKEIQKGHAPTQYRFINHRDKKIKTSQLSLLKKYNIEFDQFKLHDALYDIEMTFKIFWQQIQEIDI